MNNTREPSITYQLVGGYSYTFDDGEYNRFLGDRHVDEFIEHALMVVTPYTRVRIVVEVCE